jgi:hypothetical protein
MCCKLSGAIIRIGLFPGLLRYAGKPAWQLSNPDCKGRWMVMPLKFFTFLHRSIFEPPFYREVLTMLRRTVVFYFLSLILFFSFCIAVANTFYILSKNDGVAAYIADAFPGMKIRNGKLLPPMDTPYVPPAYLITPILNRLNGLPVLLNPEADSMVVVDTAPQLRIKVRVPVIVLTSDRIRVLFQGTSMEFPYENIMFGKKDLDFTTENLRKFLMKHTLGIFFGYWIPTVVHQGVLIFFCIFFLAFAAYIFRLERQRKFREYVRISSFAITPIALGSALVAAAGVKLSWAWHVLVLLSTVVMFRAMLAITVSNQENREV